ncbi:hypothetical protein [Verrucosispora sp. WMMC514]|uniref:hypothetical protein n=1 Tax=Verrucosispora sp. WMMC514 TaxID=3015156 RepID=UPI00248C72BF|nr:hypothetical protein [Verrucosispora sp. WMMC514]WBB94242.1 hypothetical protein O7597_15435 [Verrucosispora sp. WMMC514]
MLRDLADGTPVAFTACTRELSAGRLAEPVRAIRAPGFRHAALARVCPVHLRESCLDTYESHRRLAGWSVWTFLRWRRRYRAARGEVR